MSGTLAGQLRAAAQRLRTAGTASPEAEVRTLAAHLLGTDPSGLLLAPALDAAQQQQLDDLLTARAGGTPVQHLTGEAWFRRVRLAVGPGVFVPRPETEALVGWVLDAVTGLEPHDGPLRVVDLCTGSGAVARALADELPAVVGDGWEGRLELHAVELSEDALVWAEQNLAGTGVRLHAGDMAECLPELDDGVDVVTCNPPYIPLEAWESVAADVRDHDPALALFSGADGLDAHRVLARTAARLLRPGGLLAAEHAELQAESAPGVVVAHGGFDRVRDHLDLTGRPRFVTARRVA